MAMGQSDARLLNQALSSGYGITFKMVDGHPVRLITVVPPLTPVAEDEGPDLYTVLESLLHVGGGGLDTTLWLQLKDADQLMGAILAAQRLGSFGAGLFVSLGELTSHDPLSSLDMRLVDAVDRAAHDKEIWHPIREQMVPARPSTIFCW